MSEDEFNAAMAGARQAQSGLGGVLSGLGAGSVCTPSCSTGAANGQSINGLGGRPTQSETFMYGEQGPDTDGLASEWPGEALSATTHAPMPGHAIEVGLLQARIARKEAANEALVAKLGATLADMRSLQRQSDNWRAECQRLSALLVETQQELARRMAMPANALRHGGVR